MAVGINDRQVLLEKLSPEINLKYQKPSCC